VASYTDLQAEHQALLARLDRGEPPAAVLDAVRAFIARAQTHSAGIASARDRDQLRANLRFWGSFVFDHSGVYPDTTLRPGPTPSSIPVDTRPTPPSRPLAVGPLLLAGLAGLLCLGLVVVAGLLALNAATGLVPASETPGPILTVGGTESTPSPPVTPDLTETEIVGADMTATAAIATPTPTKAVVLGSLMLADVTLSAGPDCAARTALVSVVGGGPISPAEAAGALVELRRAGSREADAAAQFKGEGEVVALSVDVFDDEESEPFLLSVAHPTLVFSSLILQFGAGCANNVAEVRFVTTEAVAGPGAPPPVAGDLELGWELIAWGPAPEDPGVWVAQIELFADGGDGNYIFWDGEAHSADSPDILLSERACGPARRMVGVSSAGRSVLREIILQAPYCPASP